MHSLVRALLIASLALVNSARADGLLVFAAASTTEAISECAKAFRTPIDFSFGSSSDLSRQIARGAPADVFLSADPARVDALAKKVRARVDLLSNQLVVVVPKGGARLASRDDLLSVGRVALADPEAVPAGIYARPWLA